MNVEGLLALRGQPPGVDAREAESIAADLYGLTARITPLEGERDRNFRLDCPDGRKYVLKFIDREADDVVVAGQSAALAHIAEQDRRLTVPRVLRTRAGAELGVARIGSMGAGGAPVTCRVRLVTYLSGTPILDAGTARARLLRSVGNQIARLDRALTGFFHPALAQPIAWDVRRALSLLPILPEIRSSSARHLLKAALDPIQPLLRELRGLRSQAIHGDCHGKNLIVSDDGTRVGIIDLGDMIHAPLVLEIAVTMAEFLTDGIASLDALPELLAGYSSVQPLGRADIAVLYDLVSARIAIGVLIQTWRERARCEDASVGAHTGVGANAAAINLEAMSVQVLDALASRGRKRLTEQWLAAIGAPMAAGVHPAAGDPILVPDTGPDANTEAGANSGPDANTMPAGNASPAGTIARSPAQSTPAELLRRRRNTLGANAELSYDRPLHLVRGDGVWVYTADGERFLDVYNNVPHVGHAHPAVVEAIANQAKRIASNTRYLDERIIEYVERLTATLPADLDTCLFVNSGSEANDIAWRIAKQHSGHDGALVMTHAYHGITDAVTALSPAICANVPPHVEQLAAPAPASAPADAAVSGATRDLGIGAARDPGIGAAGDDAIAAAAKSDVDRAIARLASRGFTPATLMIDSALTSTGIVDPLPAWIAPIAAAVHDSGGLIIGDEVQFGLGRSGSDFWGFARRGYHPDIVTLGKPVGNGYPLGVVITRRSILEKFQRETGFFSTFGGNPVAGAAGLAVLDVLERERLVDNARTTGDYFLRRLREVAAKHKFIREVRGCGLMIGVEVTDRALTKRLVNALRDRRVLIGSEGPSGNVLKLRPPMPFGPEHVDIVIDALTDSLSAVRP